MKAFILLFALPLLGGHLGAQELDEIDLSDVVIIEDAEPDTNSAVLDQPPAVEIPEVEVDDVVPEEVDADAPEVDADAPEVENSTLDVEAPIIPEATEALEDTDIILEIPGQEAQAPGEATMATEETISVDFPDEDIRTILRNVADLFELNLVIPDALQGRTSIKLRNVSWRQVYDEVLRQINYTYVEDRNIIRITSIDELTTEPVDTRVFIVNFARANEIQGAIGPLIDSAAGGQVRVDTRSNALVITERPSRMNKIQEIIERLDQPNHQVMIESKFVEVTNSDTSNVGINWAFLQGYEAAAGPFSRDWSRSRTSSSDSSLNGSTSSSSTTNTSSGSVNAVPDPSVITTEESLGSVFDSASDLASGAATSRLDTAVFSAAEFNVVLSALKTNNDSELVSNPTVVTMDNTEAKIEIVTEVPQLEFEFNEETGTSRATGLAEPLKFGTEILVTPQVNAAGFINLNITPKVSNQIGVQETDFGDQPILSSRFANTNVMIKDGYTLALGGLTQNETQKNGTKVPVLGDLPGVGRLFRSSNDIETQRNLIIFITARTLNPDGSTYRDIVDPRIMDSMGLTPSKLPGYEIPEEQLELLKKLEEYRVRAEKAEAAESARSRLKQIEEATEAVSSEDGDARNEQAIEPLPAETAASVDEPE